jgi:hypothetical protein
VHAQGGGVLAARETEHLDREHGQHAGHQVQDQPARESEGEREAQPERRARIADHDRHVDLHGRQAGRGEDAGHARELAEGLRRERDRELERRTVGAKALRRRVLHLAFVVGEELQRLRREAGRRVDRQLHGALVLARAERPVRARGLRQRLSRVGNLGGVRPGAALAQAEG